jgi:hypothetical protein
MTTFLGVSSSDVCEWDTKPSATDRARSHGALGVGSAVPSGRAGGRGCIRGVASRARLEASPHPGPLRSATDDGCGSVLRVGTRLGLGLGLGLRLGVRSLNPCGVRTRVEYTKRTGVQWSESGGGGRTERYANTD